MSLSLNLLINANLSFCSHWSHSAVVLCGAWTYLLLFNFDISLKQWNISANEAMASWNFIHRVNSKHWETYNPLLPQFTLKSAKLTTGLSEICKIPWIFYFTLYMQSFLSSFIRILNSNSKTTIPSKLNMYLCLNNNYVPVFHFCIQKLNPMIYSWDG